MAKETRIGLYPMDVEREKGHYALKAEKHSSENRFNVLEELRVKTSDLKDYLRENRKSEITGIVPSQYSFNRNILLPPIEPKRLPEMVRFEAAQQIPFDMSEVLWNYQLLSDADEPEKKVKISAITKDVAQQYLAYPQIKRIVSLHNSLPFIYQTLKKDSEGKDGPLEAILAIGNDATEVVVSQNVVDSWGRCIVIGMKNIKDEQYGLEKGNIIHDFGQEISRSIGFYTSSNPNAKIKQLISPNFEVGIINEFNELDSNLIKIVHKNPYEKFDKAPSPKIEAVYAASGILARDDVPNLLGQNKRSVLRMILDWYLK